VLAVLLRFFLAIDGFRFRTVVLVLICLAVASMILGNLLALRQRNLKRMLAYSSIAHLGYMLVAFIPGNTMSIQAVSFYLFAYFATTLAAFGVIAILSGKEEDAEEIGNYRGLFWRHPAQACILSAALLSLAGIPLTGGFTGKFYILTTGIQDGFWALAFILVLSSVFGLYYYLRVITTMFFTASVDVVPEEKEKHPFFFNVSMLILSALAVVIIWLGVYPDQVIGYMQQLQLK
jgi:NADH-quinone oxidoreductase subunit N